MPLQNRVTPFSTIEVTPYRGLYMGNRGILHNEYKALVTQGWRTKRWIICETSFKDRQREVMKPHRYTELFFLDEAVALAAGHRPCAECRCEAFHAFVSAWSMGVSGLMNVNDIDSVLHRERVPAMRGMGCWQQRLDALPDGTMVVMPDEPGTAWLKLETGLFAWSHAGYTHVEERAQSLLVDVLTPYSTVQALRSGYRPRIHPTAAR